MSVIQERNRQLADQLIEELKRNPQALNAGKYIGIANGKVVVVTDDLQELARRLHLAEPDPSRTYVVEPGLDVSLVHEIWGGSVMARVQWKLDAESADAPDHPRFAMTNGWEKRTLADVCEISSALVDPRRVEYQSLYHVGGANIEAKTGELFDLKTAKEEGLISGKFVFDEEMVLYSKIRPYLMKVVRPDFKGLCSADIYPLAPRNGLLDRGFLYYLLLTEDFTEFAIAGSAVRNAKGES